MRIVIIVLIVVAVAFVFVAVQGGRQSGDTADDGAPPMKNGQLDKDALSGWHPPNTPAFIAKISAPFAPKLKLANPHIVLAPDQSDTRSVPSSTSQMRVSDIQITAGAGLRIGYACLSKDSSQCPETVCVCSPGTPFTSMQVSDCQTAWSNKRQNGDVCTKDDATTHLAIYPESSTLSFSALGPASVTAEAK